MRIAGLVLAGGRSSRFGSEKAMTQIGGRPMIALCADALEACEVLAVSARPASGAAAWAAVRGLPVLADANGLAHGPLAGVHAGLQWATAAGAEALATTPCDTPDLPADLLPRLLEALGPDVPGVVATGPGGRLAPLCALWRVSQGPALTAALAGGAHPPVQALLDELGFRHVAFGAGVLTNINTPADLVGPAACRRGGWPP
ncbi:molybdenum cofactor guanylyltransferase [Phenylobacterium sp.]|jgi:molybdopterin-guanine dinucleotide biosynthesis protein A|uniref:molybdenum cofactor guanylyltransferase n=1 Tax=Phenylobacterium sp. TaxID=1871053 RepID=UPI00378326B6